MRTVALEDVIEVDRAIASEDECRTMPYVGLEHVEKKFGRFSDEFRPRPEKVLATKFRFRQEHVLYGKLRPYLNKVALPYFRGVCTTEILPLLPKPGKIERGFLYAVLLSPRFVSWASQNVSGANLPRLAPDRLLEYEFPLPDLAERKRIAAILERADRLRRLRRYALEMGETVLPGAFRRMFGDPLTLMQKWERKSFGDLLATDLRNGLSPSNKGRVTARVLTLSAITGGMFDSSASKLAPFITIPPEEKRVSAGDFLICRGNGNLGLVGRGRFPLQDIPDCVFPDTMIAARVNASLICRSFVQEVWNSSAIRKQIEAAARTTNGTHKINQEVLEEMEIPVPPLAIQQNFAVLAERAERMRRIHRESLRQADHVFQTLLHWVFTSGVCRTARYQEV